MSAMTTVHEADATRRHGTTTQPGLLPGSNIPTTGTAGTAMPKRVPQPVQNKHTHEHGKMPTGNTHRGAHTMRTHTHTHQNAMNAQVMNE